MPSSTAPATPASLWLLRHAESQGNLADTKAQSAAADRLELSARDADISLSPAGEEQAAALGRSWLDLPPDQRPTVLLSSPYERAYRTARRALDAAGWDVEPVRDERLRERDLGMLDGFTKHGIERRFPEEAERRAWVGKFYYRPPGGESWADVAGRVRAVLERVDRMYAGERLLLVTHQAVIMLFRYVLEDLTEQEILELDAGEMIANTAVTRYDFEDGVPRLRSFNDTSHLEKRDAPVTEEPEAAPVGG